MSVISFKFILNVYFRRKSEVIALVSASIFGMPGGCFLFMVLYHPLHDFYNIHSEVTAVIVLMVAAVIVWKFDRKSERYEKPPKMNLISKILFAHVIVHYLVFLGTAIFLNPEDVVSVGLHQKIGNCNETEPVHTILKVNQNFIYQLIDRLNRFFYIIPFQTLERKKYLCVDDFDEKYYDFHCLPNGEAPKEGSIWYTVCGTPFE